MIQVQVKIDGEIKTLKFKRIDHLGWYFYNIMNGDIPVSEISVPIDLDTKDVFKFKVSGHSLEHINWEKWCNE